jgi:hypothetical protein
MEAMKTWQGTYIFGYGLHSIEAVDPIAEGQDKIAADNCTLVVSDR